MKKQVYVISIFISLMMLVMVWLPILAQAQELEASPPALQGEEAGQAQSQETVQMVDEIAVTASRTEMRVFDTPQSVTVITREQIKASPFENVEDIVRQAAGVYNFRHFALHTNGIASPLKMRGVGSNRVLFLVDGVPQNDNFNNSIAWVAFGYIPKKAIERIEIVRGPMSALYGSEGLGGVINVITRNPQEPRESNVTGKAGNGNTFGGDIFHSQKFGDAGVLLTGGYDKSHGFFMDSPIQPYTIKRYSQVGKIFGKATYDFSPQSHLRYTQIFYIHNQGQGRPNFHNTLGLNQFILAYEHKWDTVVFKGVTYLNQANKTAFQDATGDNYSSLNRKEIFPGPSVWGLDLQTNLFPSNWATITAGAAIKKIWWKYDEDYMKVIRDGGAQGEQLFLSPFINADFSFFNHKLIVNMGARYDWIESSQGRNWDSLPDGGRAAYDNSYPTSQWDNFSPKGGVTYHPDEKTALKVTAGTGFRAPSLFELYKIQVRGGGTFFRFANPFLQPEKITSYDVGAERFFTDQLWGRVTFYQSWASDYIGDRLLNSYIKKKKTFSEYKLENISKVDIHGLEVELKWDVRKDLSLFSNYTYNISKIAKDDNDPELEGKYLPTDPLHKFHFGVWYKNPQYVNVLLQGSYYINIYYDNENTFKNGGYFTMDASISRRFFDKVELTLDLENIFNRKYPLFMATDGTTIVPGFLAMGKLTLYF
ncbi:TonB-dependent receptor plug domain-containing protein [Desulfobacca acetoxidans]|uniref:TonB-dependent receptor plug n=1 Tax=Desulfobacca acetoxidans (strain ATCC 700848 / DSM 11109 / ASRB2) TaxID=880072 RepID=F2NJ05_DESAR|nr:TonB-dependent receptor [Desulfobacca acetoxidans]AEB07963.1 TonB-dependent receptor plug [Desulfobacca acetoxidans DSM 11109]